MWDGSREDSERYSCKSRIKSQFGALNEKTDIAVRFKGLAQIQLGKYNITPVPFRLTSTLNTTLRMFASECRLKDIFLQLELGDAINRLGHPAEISADPVSGV